MDARLFMPFGVALAALVVQAGAASAQFGLWTFVSGSGDDANPCALSRPCKTYARAYQFTLENGQITALDAGDFGGLTIGRAISIVNEVGGGMVLPAGSPGIVVDAPADAVVLLQGIDINGTGAIGAKGVVVRSASRVTIRDCNIRNFGDAAIEVSGPSGTRVTVEDSNIMNSRWGVRVLGLSGAANSVNILSSTIERNSFGVEVTGPSATFVQGSNVISSSVSDLSLLGGGKIISTGDNFIAGGVPPTTTLPLR